LRWINVERAISVHLKNMDRFDNPQTTSVTADSQPATVRVEASVVAAWPAGVSPLAQAIDACQRYGADEKRTEWLARRG
jgi:hypothetical protein